MRGESMLRQGQTHTCETGENANGYDRFPYIVNRRRPCMEYVANPCHAWEDQTHVRQGKMQTVFIVFRTFLSLGELALNTLQTPATHGNI